VLLLLGRGATPDGLLQIARPGTRPQASELDKSHVRLA